MGEFPSGQRGQTVNLLLIASVVRIHLPPPSPARRAGLNFNFKSGRIMSDIALKRFARDDIGVIAPYYPGLSSEDLDEMASGERNGRFFRFFIVLCGREPVGTVSLYQHTGYIISAGPEIFPPFRRRGYAFEAMKLAYDFAKENGFRLAQAQIRTDNEASIRLHEKLGFLRSWEDVTNRHGHKVCIYSKIL